MQANITRLNFAHTRRHNERFAGEQVHVSVSALGIKGGVSNNLSFLSPLKIIEQANTMLNRMEHRGACACDEETGDGAGVMTGIPYELYQRFAS